MYAGQMFAERQLKLSTPEKVAVHIVRIPSVMSFRINPETGSFDLVSQDDHSVGHTGGNAQWGS